MIGKATLGDYMADATIELMNNTSSSVLLLISSGVILFLAFKLLQRNTKSYLEWGMIVGFTVASLGCFQAAVSRVFYIFFETGSLVETWEVASYLYFSLMLVALVAIFCVALGIMLGKKAFNMGWVALFSLFAPFVGYWILEGEVMVAPNVSDVQMTVVGLGLVFGPLSVMIVVNAILFLLIYRETNNQGALNMALGMGVIVIAALLGAFTDLLGDIGRLFDSVSYLGVLVGMILMYKGFGQEVKSETSS